MKDNQRVAVTKRMLKEGLLRLLEEKPLEKITIMELCREAGINRTTFYRHYEFPRDILREMQEELLTEMQQSMQKPPKEDDLIYIFRYISQHAELVRLFICYNSDIEWMQMFQKFFWNILSEDTLRSYDPEEQQLFYTYHAGGIYFLIRRWLMEDQKKTPEEMEKIMLWIAGLKGASDDGNDEKK